MRLGIITYHRAINYGAVLQAFALKTFLGKMGFAVNIIDYRNNRIEENYRIFRLHCGENPIKGITRMVFTCFPFAIKKKKFERFCQKNLNLSIKCNADTFDTVASEYDIVVTGSDQVFCPQYSGFDNSYILDNVKAPIKLSYAASFGKKSISHDVAEWIDQVVYNFDALSVREESGRKIIKEKFNLESTVNIDPVFLLSIDEWNLLVPKKKTKEKYILIFTINNSNDVIRCAQQMADKTGYKIVYFNDRYYKRFHNVHYCVGKGPEVLISLIKNAEIVLTTSFHGTALSILFHKNFLVDLNLEENKADRIIELLRQFKIEQRSCRDYLDYRTIHDIDWKQVDKLIEQEKIKTEKYFRAYLE